MSDPEVIARDEFFDSLLGDFLDESGQLLDRLNEDLLRLDQWVRSLDDDAPHPCDEDLINEMFRSAHSLKGLSAMLGLKQINGLTHKIENVFDAARRDELAVSPDVVELVFQAVDRLGGLVEALKSPEADPVECESVCEQIGELLRSAGVERKQSSQADAERALDGESAAAPSNAAAESAPPVDASPERTPAPPPADTSSESAPPAPPVDYFSGLRDETETPSKYLSIFIDETEMSLDQLTETLLATESGGTQEALEKLLMTSHRIKGSAASVGLNRPAKLAHLMEDLLQNLVERREPLSPRIADALLLCTDGLRQYVEGLKTGSPDAGPFNWLAHELHMARSGEEVGEPRGEQPSPRPGVAATSAAAPTTASLSVELRAMVVAAASDPDATYVGRARFQPGLPLVGLKARLLFEKLSNLGEVCYFHPPVEMLDELDQLDAVGFGLVTDKAPDAVRRHLRMAGLIECQLEPLTEACAEPVGDRPADPRGAVAAGASSPASSPVPASATRTAAPPAAARGSAGAAEAPKARSTPESSNRPTETLRVDIERLDQLMNLAGQLVINKARFNQIGEKLKSFLADKNSPHALGDAAIAVNELFEALHQLDRVSDGIQQSVMDTRMLPIGPLFTRFKRVVRDITRANGKTVELVINGEKTELDKRMIDELGDPLIHIVRNAADHGIELPEVRQAAGKPPHGTVTLNAFHRGNNIIIQVSDDGKGLDPERIKLKAIEKGLIAEADAEKMTRSQIYQLIWEPGLSTAEKVTEVSGRGMGMDIVKSKIEDLNGTVDLDSEPGKGTTLSIKLPLTLAILPSLMVEIDGDTFAMPLEGVREIVRVGRRDLTTIHGRWTARVRGRVISVVRLGEVFTWANGAARREVGADEDATLVVVGEEGHEIGLTVDRVVGEEDVVIKSMAENYRNVPGIAGASILGDGRVSLILDLLALIEMASRCGGASLATTEASMDGAVGRSVEKRSATAAKSSREGPRDRGERGVRREAANSQSLAP